MRKTVSIPLEWIDYLKRESETGMGYQVVALKLRDGRTFDQVVAANGLFTQVRGHKEIPFNEGDVMSVHVNHKRWDFHKE